MRSPGAGDRAAAVLGEGGVELALLEIIAPVVQAVDACDEAAGALLRAGEERPHLAQLRRVDVRLSRDP
jgi:hypothetical protein